MNIDLYMALYIVMMIILSNIVICIEDETFINDFYFVELEIPSTEDQSASMPSLKYQQNMGVGVKQNSTVYFDETFQDGVFCSGFLECNPFKIPETLPTLSNECIYNENASEIECQDKKKIHQRYEGTNSHIFNNYCLSSLLKVNAEGDFDYPSFYDLQHHIPIEENEIRKLETEIYDDIALRHRKENNNDEVNLIHKTVDNERNKAIYNNKIKSQYAEDVLDSSVPISNDLQKYVPLSINVQYQPVVEDLLRLVESYH